MAESITIIPSPAERDAVPIATDFEIEISPSELEHHDRIAIPSAQIYAYVNICDSTPESWVTETYDVHEPPTLPRQGTVDKILLFPQTFSAQVDDEIELLPHRLAASDAAALLREFVRGTGRLIGVIKYSRWAVFDNEEDGLTLLVHSDKAKRQLSLEFDLDGRTIRLISIDENMQRSERSCRIEHARTLGEAIAWLSPR